MFVQQRTAEFVAAPAPLTEVLAQPLVLPSAGNPLRLRLEAAARTLGLPVRVGLEIDGWASRRSAVAAGLGPSVAGAHALSARVPAAEGWSDAVGARRIVSPNLSRQIGLRVRRGVGDDIAASVRDALRMAGAGLGLVAADAMATGVM